MMEPIYGLLLVALLIIMPILFSFLEPAKLDHKTYVLDHECNTATSLKQIMYRAQARAYHFNYEHTSNCWCGK